MLTWACVFSAWLKETREKETGQRKKERNIFGVLEREKDKEREIVKKKERKKSTLCLRERDREREKVSKKKKLIS